MKRQIREYAIQCIRDEADAVLGLIPQLDEDFERAVELIFNCKGKVSQSEINSAHNSANSILVVLVYNKAML